MLKFSQWDVMQLHVRQASRALARHKEKLIFNMISNAGIVVLITLTQQLQKLDVQADVVLLVLVTDQ